VESFVEEHYQSQIVRLRAEEAGAEGVVEGRVELRRMLEHCCAEEVEHRKEARAKAAVHTRTHTHTHTHTHT
jgi:demethoxyubiquinone hydroxylase (CLK1/Coq7/Cat5 family)